MCNMLDVTNYKIRDKVHKHLANEMWSSAQAPS